MGCRVVAVVGHIFTGSELEHFYEAQRHAPLKKEPLVEWGIAAATPTAILTPGQSRKRIKAMLVNCTNKTAPKRDTQQFVSKMVKKVGRLQMLILEKVQNRGDSGEIKIRSGLSLLPDIGRGTHENIIEQEEASLLGFDDFTTVIVDRLHHVV